MKFPPLTDGKILARYKRFFADVELTGDRCGEVVTAHCPNTGAMTGCWSPGAPAQLSKSDNPRRKLRWTLERVDMGGGWIGVNTARVNGVIKEFIAAGAVAPLRGYARMQNEPSYCAPGFAAPGSVAPGGASRFDLLLQQTGRADCYVEIKNTTLLCEGDLCFPDAVTQRGRKHLELLQHAVAEGHRAVLIFAANRPEGDAFRAAAHIDPVYAATLKRAQQNGVEIFAVRIHHTADGVAPGDPVLLPVQLA